MSQNNRKTVDLCIIGTDPGGLSLAQVYALLGLKVCLVTQNQESVFDENYYKFSFLRGVFAGDSLKDVQKTIKNLQNEPRFETILASLTSIGVEIIKNEGVFDDKGTFFIQKEDAYIKAKKFVLALGTVQSKPNLPNVEKISPLDFEKLLTIKALPREILVHGAHLDCLEMAQALNKLGCKVTILTPKRFLPQEDGETYRFFLSRLAQEDISLIEHCYVATINAQDREIEIKTGEETDDDSPIKKIHMEEIIFTSQLQVQHTNMGLSKAGVQYTPQRIHTNHALKTTNPHIYAVGGSVSGCSFLRTGDVHTGFFIKKSLFKIPFITKPLPLSYFYFTSPELFKFGLSEQEAHIKYERYGLKIRVYRLPYCDGTLASQDDKKGFLKIIACPSDRVIGGIVVGENAPYIAQSWLLACQKGLKVKDVASLSQTSFLYTELNKKLAANSLLPKLLNDRTKKIVRFLDRFS